MSCGRVSESLEGLTDLSARCVRCSVRLVQCCIWRALLLLLLRERAGAMARETGTPRGATAKLQAALLAVQLDAGRCST